jgi:hypothetical protein
MSTSNLPVYVASDAFLSEIRELGYNKSIELDDLIDLLDEDPAYMFELWPSMMTTDEINYVSPALAKFMYQTLDARPT